MVPSKEHPGKTVFQYSVRTVLTLLQALNPYVRACLPAAHDQYVSFHVTAVSHAGCIGAACMQHCSEHLQLVCS